MQIIIQDTENKKHLINVISGMPVLEEGWTVIGPSEEHPEIMAEIEVEKAAAAQQAQLAGVYDKAEAFGRQLIKEFAMENIAMGITADGMTGTVRKNMAEVIMALTTASLYDAITEAKAVPPVQYDAKYITAARLLSFVNKIEAYLNIPLSTEL